MALTSARPAGRMTTVSVTGSGGMRSMTLAHHGSSETAVAPSTAYGPRAASGTGGCSSRNRGGLAGRRGAAQLRSVGVQAVPEPGHRAGRVGYAERGGHAGQVADVGVLLGRVHRRRAVALVGGQEAVGLGDVDPGQEVGIVGVVGTAVRGDAMDSPVHTAHGRAAWSACSSVP